MRISSKGLFSYTPFLFVAQFFIAIPLLFTSQSLLGIGLLIGFFTFVLVRIYDGAITSDRIHRDYEVMGFYDDQISQSNKFVQDFIWSQRERFKHTDIIKYGKNKRPDKYDEVYDIVFDFLNTLSSFDIRGLDKDGFDIKQIGTGMFQHRLSKIEEKIYKLEDPVIIKLWEIGTTRSIFDMLAHLELRLLEPKYVCWNTYDYCKHKHNIILCGEDSEDVKAIS